jgi:FMN phosphatase YigB (HAD superfamily)
MLSSAWTTGSNNTAVGFDALFSETTGNGNTAVGSAAHGKTKPHEAIFRRMLELLDVAAGESAMVGDSPDDDIDGALAVGMQAVLIDREDRHPEVVARLRDLRGLPVALGLV